MALEQEHKWFVVCPRIGLWEGIAVDGKEVSYDEAKFVQVGLCRTPSIMDLQLMERVRMVVRGTAREYEHTMKSFLSPGVCEEKTVSIDERQFSRFYRESRHPLMRDIVKTRRTFLHGGRKWELDEFHSPQDMCCVQNGVEKPFWGILEVEVDDIAEPVSPPGISIKQDELWSHLELVKSDSIRGSNAWIALTESGRALVHETT